MRVSVLIAILVCISGPSLKAETLDAVYRVSFGIFGEIGIAKAHLEKNGEQYLIRVEGEATGIAKKLSKGRREVHISKGHIKNALLLSDTYTVIKSYGEKNSKKHYTVDHKKKQVVKYSEKSESGKQISRDEKVLDFYAENDLLTLYFNIASLITEKEKKGVYTFNAVGAEKQKGSVMVIVPDAKERIAYETDLGKGSAWYLTAIIHQKIFASDRGELILAIGKDGITEKAVLKDVVMFGDVMAQRIK
ncbi:MAG: DUF3108 domain-containing protein [Campylobacterota bacterium]|nr:DUF3108 domain-containing protein [Campylobacterota bacterium]